MPKRNLGDLFKGGQEDDNGVPDDGGLGLEIPEPEEATEELVVDTIDDPDALDPDNMVAEEDSEEAIPAWVCDEESEPEEEEEVEPEPVPEPEPKPEPVVRKPSRKKGTTMEEIPLGTKVQRYPIEKYKASTINDDRIALIDGRVRVARYHYEKGIGYFHCFEGDCCRENGMPAPKYVLLIVKYHTDEEGTLIDEKVAIQFIVLSEEKYNTFAMLKRTGTDPKATDFYINCTDDGFQKFTLQPIGDAEWQKWDKAEAVREKAAELYDFVPMAIAQEITAEEYCERKGGRPTMDAPLDEFTDI